MILEEAYVWCLWSFTTLLEWPTKEFKKLIFASSKVREFIFTRHMQYLCCFAYTTRINKPLERHTTKARQASGFQQERVIIQPSERMEWSPELTQYPWAHPWLKSQNKLSFEKPGWAPSVLMLPAAARQMCPHGPWGCLKTAHTYADKAVTLGHKKARRERGRSWSHAIPARSSRQVNV